MTNGGLDSNVPISTYLRDWLIKCYKLEPKETTVCNYSSTSDLDPMQVLSLLTQQKRI
jgi:hypothetical protein